MFADILYEEEERAITGFLNSSGDLEYSIYKCVDGGFIDLEDRVYDEDELLTLLQIELDDLINRTIPTLFILGHNICVTSLTGNYILRSELDEEVYEISHSIMQGDECGEIFIVSKKEKAFWLIV